MRELALHILDIAQNSLEAGATDIEIAIHEDLERDQLDIQVTDNGRGMDAEMLSKVLDPFVTTRTTRRMGLGLPLFAAAAERCAGKLDIFSEPGQGTTVTATFQHSHIDRAPLGDMQATLMAVILADERVRIRYSHLVADKAFELDTDEIRQELEGVPLNYGPITQWLRQYIQEQTEALYENE